MGRAALESVAARGVEACERPRRVLPDDGRFLVKTADHDRESSGITAVDACCGQLPQQGPHPATMIIITVTDYQTVYFAESTLLKKRRNYP